jgi:hypothetical protein
MDFFDALLVEKLTCNLSVRDIVAMMGCCRCWRHTMAKKFRWHARARFLFVTLSELEKHALSQCPLPNCIKISKQEGLACLGTMSVDEFFSFFRVFRQIRLSHYAKQMSLWDAEVVDVDDHHHVWKININHSLRLMVLRRGLMYMEPGCIGVLFKYLKCCLSELLEVSLCCNDEQIRAEMRDFNFFRGERFRANGNADVGLLLRFYDVVRGANCLSRRRPLAMVMPFPPIAEFLGEDVFEDDWFEEIQEEVDEEEERQEKRRRVQEEEEEEEGGGGEEEEEEEEEEIGKDEGKNDQEYVDSDDDMSSSELAEIEKLDAIEDEERNELFEARNEFTFDHTHAFLLEQSNSDLIPLTLDKVYARADENSDFIYNFRNCNAFNWDARTRKQHMRSLQSSTGPFLHPISILSMTSSRSDMFQLTEIALNYAVIPFLEAQIDNLLQLFCVLSRGELVANKESLIRAIEIQGHNLERDLFADM